MIQFTEARAIVEAIEGLNWEGERGTFYVAEYGWENDTFWSLAVGAREWLVDDDQDFATDDDRLFFVNKETGELTTPSAVDFLDQLVDFTPVGDVPED
jgi:hypothetical protein